MKWLMANLAICNRGSLFFLFLISMTLYCGGNGDVSTNNNNNDTTPKTSMSISGTITYDDYAVIATKLDYNQKTIRNVRRVIVQAIDSSATVQIETSSNDSGEYTLTVPLSADPVKVRVLARVKTAANIMDSISPDTCSSAKYDTRVVDNTNSQSLYSIETSTAYTETTSAVNLHAPTTHNGTNYTARTGAVFALLDTFISTLETMCQGKANLQLPELLINFSKNNVAASGSLSLGQINTTHFALLGTAKQANIYILGSENVDTDEYDDHVIAHELGHFFEHALFRTDSQGGSHQAGDYLDPRVAFGEGFANALSAMAFGNPIYVDTNGAQQQSGFSFSINSNPSLSMIVSEYAVHQFLYKLWDSRDTTANSGSFTRIYNILANFTKSSSGLVSIHSFAAYYNQVYGNVDSLQSLYTTGFNTSYNSLCSGSCTGTGDTADIFDSDNDLGTSYSALTYASSGNANAEFWRLYRTLSNGTNTGNNHDKTVDGTGGTHSSFSSNKYGNNRLYKYTAAATGSKTISVSNLGGGICTTDHLDMKIYGNGNLLGQDVTSSGTTAGCPSVTVSLTSGKVYIIVLQGFNGDLSSFDISIL